MPDRQLTLAEVALSAYMFRLDLPADMESGLASQSTYDHPLTTLPNDDRSDLGIFYPFVGHAWHIAVIEVDPETGKFEFLRYAAVHDAGTIVNPKTLNGQIIGGTVQGLGTALLEEYKYDDQGRVLNEDFEYYHLPSSMDAPVMTVDHQETPSPYTPYGIKGAGEGGRMLSPGDHERRDRGCARRPTACRSRRCRSRPSRSSSGSPRARARSGDARHGLQPRQHPRRRPRAVGALLHRGLRHGEASRPTTSRSRCSTCASATCSCTSSSATPTAPAFHHIGINVDDFETAYERVQSLGIAEKDSFFEDMYELPDGSVQMYLRDPAGNLIEIDWPDVTTIDRSRVPTSASSTTASRRRGEALRATLYLDRAGG